MVEEIKEEKNGTSNKQAVGMAAARLSDTYYTGLEADTATYRSDTVLYVSECLIVNI